MDTSQVDVDENSFCKNLSVLQAKLLLLRSFSVNFYTLEGYCKNKPVLVGFFELLMVTCIAVVKIMVLTFPSVI